MFVASRSMPGFAISGRLATLDWCNEAENGFTCVAADAFAFRGFETADYSDARSVSYMANEQLP